MSRHSWKTLATGMVIAVTCVAILPSDALAEKRSFTVAAIEPKGGVTVDKEPFPLEALPSGGGYVLNKPDGNNRWEVSTYLWTPGQIIVNEGDEVTLEFVGIRRILASLWMRTHGKQAMSAMEYSSAKNSCCSRCQSITSKRR